jgi:hypothetical protein
MSTHQREIYNSENGDKWFLCRDNDGGAFVLHKANVSSGGTATKIELGDFLGRDKAGPAESRDRVSLQVPNGEVASDPVSVLIPRQAAVLIGKNVAKLLLVRLVFALPLGFRNIPDLRKISIGATGVSDNSGDVVSHINVTLGVEFRWARSPQRKLRRYAKAANFEDVAAIVKIGRLLSGRLSCRNHWRPLDPRPPAAHCHRDSAGACSPGRLSYGGRSGKRILRADRSLQRKSRGIKRPRTPDDRILQA